MPNNDGNIVKRTSQYIDNLGFDETFGVPMLELVGTSDGTDLNRLKVNPDGSLATGGSISATQAEANNTFGTATSLAATATATLVNIASSVAGFKLRGFTATGQGDGYFFVQVANQTILSGRINNTKRDTQVILPNPVSVTTGSLVTLQVTNESETASSYEATLLGE